MVRSVKRFDTVLNVVGFDPGTSFGFAWLKIEGSKVSLMDSGTWDLLPDKDMNEGAGVRFIMCERYIKYFFGKVKPNLVVYEAVMRHMGTRAAHIYGGFEALIGMICEQKNIPYFSYMPSTIKKATTGYGKASKEEVAEALKSFFSELKFRTNDESDAVAIAVTGARKQGWLELK